MKRYRSKKKVLFRRIYFNEKGIYNSVRDTGTKSGIRFQQRINAGMFE